MLTRSKFTQHFLSFGVAVTLILSTFRVPLPVAHAQVTDGIQRQFNTQTGKLSFITPETGSVLPAIKALEGTPLSDRQADPAFALIRRFGVEFGLKDPQQELTEMHIHHFDSGRLNAKYQQHYLGIPVIGGELIVNTNENGDLYSINGEVAKDLSLPAEPTIDPEQAQQTAVQGIAKWYQKTLADFVASQPELWIFDPGLLTPNARPPELVWRMEVTAVDNLSAVRELVLINAQSGYISLHFNQIDTAWTNQSPRDEANISPHSSPTEPRQSIEKTENDASLVKSSPLAVTTWYVSTTGNDLSSCSSPDSPCATIDAAISKAAAGDVINVAAGSYTSNGDYVVMVTKSVTLSGGWNSAFTAREGLSTVDGQNLAPCFWVDTGLTVTIEFFHATNGRGGIHNDGSNLTLNNIEVSSQTLGGGIRNTGGTVTLSNSSIWNNSANEGGGIYNSGTMTVNNSSVGINTVAGIFNLNGTLTINDSTISGNSYGGIRTGGSGGVVYLNNSTVSGNYNPAAFGESGRGGGIYNNGDLIVLQNSTVTNNTADSGGGIYNNSASVPSAVVNLQNSIVAGNNVSGNGPDCVGTIYSSGYNLVGNTSSCGFGAAKGDLRNLDAKLAPLGDNGGLTLTHALYPSSPAIDAGSPLTPGSTAGACLTHDQRGIVRPIGSKCDIGAYEALIPDVATFTAMNQAITPGHFLCDETQPMCTNGANPHADKAHTYAIGTYNFYAAHYGRNSINNMGMQIISTVHYKSGYANASWNGSQMVYGDVYDFPLADDIVAHELTHGVTQFESNLFYFYQSGSINESFSDLWGEYYDQTNGLGNDTTQVKWELGEEAALPLDFKRSMSDPTKYHHPDRMKSPYYYKEETDQGGVHENSGVNNKAVYLLVDGDSFNGKTITRLGWEKTAAIYYEANTSFLVSGADYSDLYYALQQACRILTGKQGITETDCQEVRDALDAVEMDAQPEPAFTSNPPYCDQGNPVTIVFSDDLEAGIGNWYFTNGVTERWRYDSPIGPIEQYAHSGIHFLYANDQPAAVTDATAKLVALDIPTNAYLHFAHAFQFESSPLLGDKDGGVLEYRINGSSAWVDAGSLIKVNSYNGSIASFLSDNPLKGRSAFIRSSHGYVSSRLDLAPLAGKIVSFRWRMGLDGNGSGSVMESPSGWWVDDVKVYTCEDSAGLDGDTTGVFRPSNGLLYLKNKNDTGFADMALNYGLPGDYPVVGDWDGNGTATIGIYRNGQFMLRNSNTLGFADLVFAFGTPGDQPIAGDWDGDGVDTIGIYRASTGQFLLRNSNTAGAAEMSFYLGNVGDVGIAGDWTGKGYDTVGVFRPSNGIIFLKNTNETGFADIALNYGIPGDRPVTGDWDNDGVDTIGVYRNGQFMLRNSNDIGFADIVFGLGNPGDMPIAGDWDGLP